MPYFTTAEFRTAMADMDNEPKYPDVEVERARDYIEALIERVCATSFIARAVTEVVDGSGTYSLPLSAPYILSITSVTIDGAALTGYTYTFTAGLLERNATGTYTPTTWTSGRRNISVVYSAGYSATAPADLKEAAMTATRDRVLSGSATSGKPSERATSLTNEFGNVQFSIAGADRPTGLPDVDATIMGWAAKVNVYGFA